MSVKKGLALVFKNNLCQSLRLGVGNTNRYPFHAKLPGDFCGFTSQRDARPPTLLTDDLQVNPANPAPPPGPQRLHGRFLRGKAPSIAFELILESLAIFDFLRREDAIKKSLPAALNSRLYARHFGNIDTQANDQEIFLARKRADSREL